MCYSSFHAAAAVPQAAGRRPQFGRITLIFKTPPDQVAYTLVEAIEPPGASAGLHCHPAYDETHIVVAGRYECRLGGETLMLGPGEMMLAPRGVRAASRASVPTPAAS